MQWLRMLLGLVLLVACGDRDLPRQYVAEDLGHNPDSGLTVNVSVILAPDEDTRKAEWTAIYSRAGVRRFLGNTEWMPAAKADSAIEAASKDWRDMAREAGADPDLLERNRTWEVRDIQERLGAASSSSTTE